MTGWTSWTGPRRVSSTRLQRTRKMNRRNVAFVVTLVRGLLAVTLGVVLLFQPDKSRSVLVNFMGMYWLVSGLISLRWGIAGRRAAGLWLLAGLAGVLAGIGTLLRGVATTRVQEEVFITTLALVIALTGLVHVFGGFRTGPDLGRRQSWSAFLLGVFEIILGLLLAFAPLERGTGLYLAASVWALVGGFILIGDAMALRRSRGQA
jgi:uncharacterized membrane protein HdeD (DUF308 family)